MEKEFTKQAQQVLNKAKSLARRFHHPYIGTEHLLLALRQEFTGVAGQVLAMNRVEEEQIRKIIDELVSPMQEIKNKTLEFNRDIEIPMFFYTLN